MADIIRDGCPAFDEQLIELAVQPVAPPELEAHLAVCERCRLAYAQYRDTVRIIGAALTIGPTAVIHTRRSRPVRQVVQALAASALTAAAILLSWSPPEIVSSASMSIHPEAGTTVQLFGPGRAVIRAGTSTFVIGDADMVVETPAGQLSCNACEFTVEITECRNCLPNDLPACEPGPVCVTLFVAAGLVGSDIREQRAPLGPGGILTWSVPTSQLASLTHLQ